MRIELIITPSVYQHHINKKDIIRVRYSFHAFLIEHMSDYLFDYLIPKIKIYLSYKNKKWHKI